MDKNVKPNKIIFDVNFEKLILSLCLKDKAFFFKSIIVLNPKYFSNEQTKIIFILLLKYFKKYRDIPEKEVFIGECDSEVLNDLYTRPDVEKETKEILLEKVEEWMKRMKAIEATQLNSIDIKNGEYGMLEERMKEVAKISITTDLGFEYLSDLDNRIAILQDEEKTRVRFTDKFKHLNIILGGGIPRKTLQLIQGRSNIGKTLFLNALSKDYMESHLNVVYITLEISEIQIVKRLDAMTSHFSPNELLFNSKKLIEKLKELKESTEGSLFIKEYPTGSITVHNIRNYLNDLVLRTGIIPDVIFVDYMDLMRPIVKINLSDTYNSLKFIAEDLRALAVEWNCIVWSASQIQRGHYDIKADQDLGMSAGATSIAKSETTDLLLSISQDDILESRDLIKGYVAKCRYSRPHKNMIFKVNYDYLDVSEDVIMTKYSNGMGKADIMAEFYNGGKKKVITNKKNPSEEQFENFNEISSIFN